MSKNTSQTNMNRQRRAARRARTAARRARRQSRKSASAEKARRCQEIQGLEAMYPRDEASGHAKLTGDRAARTRTPRHFATIVGADGRLKVTEVAEADLGLHMAYMEAHRLLPPGYPRSGLDVAEHLPAALATLDEAGSPSSPSESVLTAIMILGHTPSERALVALRRHASRGGVHAGMARLAADECAWFARMSTPGRNDSPRPNPMLN